jgi:hypothetical protein
MHRLFTVVVFSVLFCGTAPQAHALEATATAAFVGDGGCPVCGTTSFACSGGEVGVWNNGQVSFQDPLPTGTWEVTEVQVQVEGGLDCGDPAVGQTSVALNGGPVGVSQPAAGGCACDGCDSATWSDFGFSDSNYVHEGMNTVTLTPTDEICVTTVEVFITYVATGDDDDAADDDDAGDDDDDAANDDDSASGDDDDDGGGRGGSRRRGGCDVGDAGTAGWLAALLLTALVGGARRRTS